ncbi:TonB-dependent receptor [Granulicella tundricola]|uniref:TonB-dependent receptor domain protein n=1 Tax=Granulicella tundricola (strain ATCC BAA-1859 / DSM 23138 / MP5ACTX9) TaxID=1198114 RepID=E8WV85_GRATM|nr:carboxypeptidase-like regulatory domain-containing protein [Granulicella tundricola]ADW67260.1 TonB-dependent receptor domain protein [Granulicella tundricola MP5ACTX9]
MPAAHFVQTRHHLSRILLRPIETVLRVIVCSLLALFLAFTAKAQVVGGTIAGIVTDATGAAVPHAHVRIHNEDTGTERRIDTDATGHYSAPSVTVGTYTVTVGATSFATERKTGIGLTIGQATEVDLVLPVAGAEQEVTVADTPAVVNDSTQQVSGLVSERQVKGLPLNGRSYDQLITLNPGTVNYTAQRSGSVGTSNSSVGNMFAVSGRRPQDNLYLLNGVEYTGASLINVTPGGTSGQLLGVDAVREFNVVADTYGANYGKRQGAQISIVTVSGTNALHGSAYEFLRNSYLDSRNYFDQSRIPNFQRNNFGAALGGPIKKDKVFLFGNYEGYRQNLGITDVTLVPDNQARAGFLPNSAGVETKTAIGPGVAQLFNLWPVQNGPELLDQKGNLTGIGEAFSSPTQHIREDFGTARFDANLTANDLFFAVYTVDDSTANTPTQNPYSLINEDLREQVLSAQEQHVFSARLLNTARVGFSRASFLFLGSVPANVQALTGTFIAGKPIGAVVIAGSTASNGSSQITGAGANVGSDNAITRNLFTFDDHIFYTIGKHQIEAGGWAQRLQSNDNLAQNQYGQASFASLATFLTGTVKTFTVVPAPTELGWRAWFGAGYIEDTWRALPSLEISAGLRVETSNGFNESKGRAGIYGFTNGVINSTPTVGSAGLTNNRAKFLPEPRVGAAWKATSDGKTVVRAGFGLHHSLLDNLDYRFDQAAPFNTTLSYSGVPISAPTSGAAGLVSPSNVQTDLQTPTVLSYTLRVEQQIAPSTSLTIAYVGSHGYHQILSEDQNEPASIICQNNCPAGIANGTIYYPTVVKANAAVANTTSWVSQGASNYNALEVDLRRAFAGGFQFRANYTFAKNLDNGSAWNTSVSANTPAFVSYPNNAALDYGPAATDVRHLAAFNGTYDLPFGKGTRFLNSKGGIVDRAAGGWTLSTIATLQTGLPFSPQLGYNPTGSGDTRNPVRPNANPNFRGSLYTHGTTAQRAAQFFDPAAFTAPAYGTVGNLGRDTLTGPGFADWDLSLLKSIKFSESKRLQFRAEFFNILNHTNFLTPNEVVFSSGPTQDAKTLPTSGTLSTAQAAAPVQSPTAGVITAAATSRQIQLGLKFLF